MDGSIPYCHASCSSGTPLSRATGRPGTGSSTRTGSCWTRSLSSSTERDGATSWLTTRPCSRSTTPASAPRWSPAATSTAGGSGSGPHDPDLLNFEKAMLVKPGAGGLDRDHYPDEWRQGSLALPLTYQFEPGTEADGVTVHIPLPVLNQVRPDGFDWQIPGLRRDLVTALLRSLPKATRRNFVPVPDYAAALLAALPSQPCPAPLVDELAAALRALTGRGGTPRRLGAGQGTGPSADHIPGGGRVRCRRRRGQGPGRGTAPARPTGPRGGGGADRGRRPARGCEPGTPAPWPRWCSAGGPATR